MKVLQRFLMGFGSLLLLAVSVQLFAPKAVHAVVSTLITVANTTSNPVPSQQVIPSQPFFARLSLSGGATQAAGPGSSGRLAVTSITISNLSMTTPTQEVYILAPVVAGGSCGDAVTGGGDPTLRLLVPQAQTLTVTFPTPLVFSPVNGVSCIAAENFVDSLVEVYVNGFVQ